MGAAILELREEYMRFTGVTALIITLGGLAFGCSNAERPTQPGLIPAMMQGTTETEGDLRYTTSTMVEERFPIRLMVNVTVENIGRRPAALEFSDGCPVLLRVYDNPEREGAPVWDQSMIVYCTQALQMITIRPRDSRVLRAGADAPEILGDSLPSGYYYISALVKKTGWPLELDAGAVFMSRTP